MTPPGRQGELLAQLRELLTLPSSPPANKLESAVGPLAGAAGPGPSPPPQAAAPSTAMASGGRRRQRGSSKRGWDDEVTNGEHHGEDLAAGAAAVRPRRQYCKRRRKKQQSGTSMVVTSAPDLFDGYQWRKYGQKLIEGAMYPRSYYRCTRSAEQGCAAKRTVQRNDDGGAATAAAAPKYTVVRVGEHTCTANDSPEAPVILETTAVVVPASNSSTAPTSSSAAASCSTTTVVTESPVNSDNTWSTITSSVSDCSVDDYCGGLFATVHDNDWVPALAAPRSPLSLPTIEDFAGPIRSPVHISAADGWTIDLDHQFLLQLVNEPTIIFQHL
ncbi:probable WRKY transcription factor 29 [Miscanthus floridulus]|uniref:probable WRKY transcription factor 29 n=1 Tax=Miscanthus floridulus TaxID=154761 RepID=UPI003459E139